ncbi:MAG TPA: mechanosensitive ion channel family protein [Allosphingosinicella sp.]|nr:mechanosensitive ion channel family protein [Allosphingosinicella sp.]
MTGTPRARNLYERSAERWHEIADWVSANSLDLMMAALAAALLALLLVALRSFGHRLIRERDEATGWRAIFGRVLARTGLFFIAMTALKLVSAQSAAPPFLQRTIDILFVVAAALQAAVWGRELILGFIQHRVGDEEEHGRLSSAIGIIRLLVTVTLFAIAIILILSNLGVNVTGLVAGLGIGGIAIGLAAQGIFSDLFAALSIIFDKPFRRGDTITFGSPPTTGTVEQIGLKSTRVRSLNGEEVVISNTKLLDQQLQNWALLSRRRALMQFGVTYQTPPELLARIPDELKAIVERQPLAEFDRCHAWQFGPSSIDFELVFHVDTPDMGDFMQVRQEVMLGMIRRFAELGVDFAYPTQTTFTAAPDGTLVMPYAPARAAGEPDREAKPAQR